MSVPPSSMTSEQALGSHTGGFGGSGCGRADCAASAALTAWPNHTAHSSYWRLHRSSVSSWSVERTTGGTLAVTAIGREGSGRETEGVCPPAAADRDKVTSAPSAAFSRTTSTAAHSQIGASCLGTSAAQRMRVGQQRRGRRERRDTPDQARCTRPPAGRRRASPEIVYLLWE